MKIKRLAIANRGEVAVRIIRACEELGIESVLLHSEPDIKTRAFRLANKTMCIGPAPSAESYLNIEANIQGAIAARADGIHPGFGFLSENSNFVRACEKSKLIFVGPSASSMEKLGDKVNCKKLAQALGVPLIPGYESQDQSIDRLVSEAQRIGFPVIVKAAAGGGGRGMKVIRNEKDAKEQIESAQRESQAAFGSAIVFLEKYLEKAKHIEFQVFVDCTGRARHLMERECSVQRRHQKIIEESLSPSLTPELRRKMGEAACLLVSQTDYRGAATVEFLLEENNFYLLEVNTRLQVEHPVTELVQGVDLVKAQILTAQNEIVWSDALPPSPRGHSIECRIYAENPYEGGIPSTGLLGLVQWPEGPGRRFEYGFESGDIVTSNYDSMIAKVIVWDETRSRCIQKMQTTLKNSIVFGVETNIPLLRKIMDHPEFISGTMTTQFMGKYFSESLTRPALSEASNQVLNELKKRVIKGSESNQPTEASPWKENWRIQ